MRLAIGLLAVLLVPGFHVAAGTSLGDEALVPALAPSEVGDAPTTWVWSAAGTDDHAEQAADALLAVAPDAAWHRYEALDMLAFVATADVARHVAAATGGRVTPNEQYELHLDQSVDYIEADRVRRAVGDARTGPTVLVIDTGVDPAHPDFQGGNLVANVGAARARGLVIGTFDQVPVVDAAGHGTHVAGIVGGSGSAGPYEGLYSNGRIASYQASTPLEGDDEPSVDTIAALEAFDWALQNRRGFDIRVITNSWGIAGPLDADHPINDATLRAYLAGMVVTFSAGNQGEAGTLNRHCLPPWVLCVAAGDLHRSRAPFSAYGETPDPRRPWDHPDLTAPGHFIRAPRPVVDLGGGNPQSPLASLFGASQGDLYVDRSGTSMAAPHVAGTAALLFAARPDLSPDEVMDALVGSANPMADDVHRVGTGYLNARAAYNTALSLDGNRLAFESGRLVKYGGATTGDPHHARDPVTAGLDPDFAGAVLLPPAQGAAWVSTWPAWVILGLAGVLMLSGIRFRR